MAVGNSNDVPGEADERGDVEGAAASHRDSASGSEKRQLPPPNLPARSHAPPWNFGLEHRYDPPLEFNLEQPLTPGDARAFMARLPNPPNGDEFDQAFFYRLGDGEIVGYFNRCTHVSIPLDYDDGLFLDTAGFIMCRVHGARYELETGLRCFGPARTNLTRILIDQAHSDPAVLRVLGWEKVR